MSAAEADGPLLFLVGATASGKKAAARAIAPGLGAELLALDSMKVYRGMDLGTDKSAETRFGLTDLVDPDVRFSVGAYVRAAQDAVAAIRGRGRVPLFVGGTGLYLRALVRGIFDVPEIPAAVRAAVTAELDRDGAAAGHAALRAVDADAAAKLHPSDRKRIARALEIVRATGTTLTQWQAQATRRPIAGRALLVGIRWRRPELKARITRRVERMFADGLVDEVRALQAAARIGPVAGLAIGYREVVEMLASDGDAAQCMQAIVRNTWTFVRRQDNWLRQFKEIRWVDAELDPASVPARVEAAFRALLAEGDGAGRTARTPIS